jgi:hypothetical protein
VTAGCSLAESSKEGYGLRRAVLISDGDNNSGNKIHSHFRANLTTPRPITK